MIIPSYAAKANTVLNNILYPKEELEKSYTGLNRTPAPYGHPMLNGNFVPAKDPEAMARSSIFAWNENASWDGDRIALNVVVDVERANESERGRKVLEAIRKEQPISTSTGLLCNLETSDSEDYEATARNIEWDHVAILLDEEPAISTNEGVGLFVNSSNNKELQVVNSYLDDESNYLMDRAAELAFRALEQQEKAPLMEKLKSALTEAFRLGREPNLNKEETSMSDKDLTNGISERVDALTEKVNGLDKTIADAVAAAMQPLVDAQKQAQANQEAAAKAAHDELVNKVVEAGIDGFNKDVAEKMDATALNALLSMHNAKAAAPKAAPLVGGFAAFNGNKEEDSMSPLGWGAKQ
jgi:hypothetical protein